jgi:hypothetical protein
LLKPTGLSVLSPLRQMVLRTVRWEVRSREMLLKAFKIKLAQGGPLGSGPLRSDVLVMARWKAEPLWKQPKPLKGEVENNSRKSRDLTENRHKPK